MQFVNYEQLDQVTYETAPFPHVIIDNFLHTEKLDDILFHINSLQNRTAEVKHVNPKSPFEYNKFAWKTTYGDYVKQLFVELTSDRFICALEKLTGIRGLVKNDINLQGAGIHRITNGGYLQLHTDFNSYYYQGIKLDRRINLLLYMNPDWKDEYNGALCLCDKEKRLCVKKISPILNRCVIFNTTNRSIHGHPEILRVPPNVYRQSIAVYYYTRNINGKRDFEGDPEHSTIWYPQIRVDTM